MPENSVPSFESHPPAVLGWIRVEGEPLTDKDIEEFLGRLIQHRREFALPIDVVTALQLRLSSEPPRDAARWLTAELEARQHGMARWLVQLLE